LRDLGVTLFRHLYSASSEVNRSEVSWLVMNMMNVFVNILQLWNKDTMENGPLQYWLATTAGHSRDVPE